MKPSLHGEVTGKVCMQAQEEVDRVMGDKSQPEVGDYKKLNYLMRCVNESMRLYPHPPVLLRRAQIQDELPGALLPCTDSESWTHEV